MRKIMIMFLGVCLSCTPEEQEIEIETTANPDYCEHPLIVGHFNPDGTVTYYDFTKCR